MGLTICKLKETLPRDLLGKYVFIAHHVNFLLFQLIKNHF